MKVDKQFLYLDDELKGIKVLPKIYASKFGNLAGHNPKYTPKGDSFLNLMKLVDKDVFNPFYGARGEYAERLLVDLLETKEDIQCKYFGRSASGEKVFNIFNNDIFGGVMDILLKKDSQQIEWECKSKNIKDYSKIKNGGVDPVHKAQAALYAYLGNIPKYQVVYVFFTNEQEAIITERMKTTDNFIDCEKLFNFDYGKQVIKFDFVTDRVAIRQEMADAYKYANKCLKEKRIPINDLSSKMLQKIGMYEADPFKSGFDNVTKIDFD